MHHIAPRRRLSIFHALLASALILTTVSAPAIAEVEDVPLATEQPSPDLDASTQGQSEPTETAPLSAPLTPTENSAVQEGVQGASATIDEASSLPTDAPQGAAAEPASDPQTSSDPNDATTGKQATDAPDEPSTDTARDEGASAEQDDAGAGTTELPSEDDNQGASDSGSTTTDPSADVNALEPETTADATVVEASHETTSTSSSTTPEEREEGSAEPVTKASPTAAKQPVLSATASKNVSPTAAKTTVSAGNLKVEGSYYLVLSGTSRVVEVRRASMSNGAEIWLYGSNGKQHQKIYLERDAKGYYTAWIVGTGKVLDLKGGSTKAGTKIIQWRNTGKDNQKWAIAANKDGSYRLVNKATGLVLGKASSGYGLVGMKDNGAKTNMFLLKPADLLSAGIYRIAPRSNSATNLDVARASTANGAKLMLYRNSGALNQRFELVSAGSKNLWYIRTASSGGWVTYKDGKLMQDGSGSRRPIGLTWRCTFQGGWYSLINVRSGKALDLRGGKTTSGTNVVANTQNGKDSQHFTFVPASLVSAGTYYIRSSYGTNLDVKGSSTRPGANVQMYTANTSLAQRFKLVKAGSAFRIINARSGLAVAVSNVAADKANVTQKRLKGSNNQLWKPVIADGGRIAFKNVASGKLLDASGSKSKANVVQRTEGKDAKGSSWKLVKAPTTNVTVPKQATTRILMLGNSFTFWNDMPARLGKLANAEVQFNGQGGLVLSKQLDPSHAIGAKTLADLDGGDWDFVVIQEYSSTPVNNYTSYQNSLTKLVKLARQTGATPIIYGTWAYDRKQNGETASGLAADKKMHAKLQSAFSKASKATSVTVANVGAEFANRSFATNLYDSDGKHPSYYGSGVSASIICNTIKSLQSK